MQIFQLIGTVCLGLLLNNTALAITAPSWAVADHKGKIIEGENVGQVRSIASISKLVTVMTVLDAHQDLDEPLKPYTRRELIKLAMITSDNTAANRLCDLYPGGRHACVMAMNKKVYSLGLSKTKFVEPTGLSVFNVSTVDELIVLVLEAERYTEIVESSQISQTKVKKHTIKNTNPLVEAGNVIVSKTGYIQASGGCIVMLINSELGRRVVVLLGSKNTKTRIPEAKTIAGLY
jgi:D-alanyl-D-alanine endopeptidase (penicillin-binding protein 7)